MALALPTAAQAQLPVGSANGVKIVRDRGIVVVFTQRATNLWRQVAGRRVTVKCTELMDPDDSGLQSTFSGEQTFRAPRRGRRLRTGDLTRGIDYCTVHLAPRTVGKGERRRRLSREWIVSIPLSQVGAVFLDELQRSWAMMSLLLGAELLGDRNPGDGFFTPAELVTRVPRLDRPLSLRVVAMASAGETPPTGAVGYWSDGAQKVAVAVLSASGRRLFIEFSEDDVLRTNVAGYIYTDSDDF